MDGYTVFPLTSATVRVDFDSNPLNILNHYSKKWGLHPPDIVVGEIGKSKNIAGGTDVYKKDSAVLVADPDGPFNNVINL